MKQTLAQIFSNLKCGLSILLLLLTACQRAEPAGQLPTPMPTASFLPWIYPEASSVMTLEDFQLGYQTPSSQLLQNAVCVELNGYELVEDMDNGLELEDYIERSLLVIDGERWFRTEPKPIIDFLGAMQEVKRNTETGEVIVLRSNATGPFTVCWQVELGEGVHNIEFQTHKTSGEPLSYSWTFYITD